MGYYKELRDWGGIPGGKILNARAQGTEAWGLIPGFQEGLIARLKRPVTGTGVGDGRAGDIKN